jgi:afadin
VYQLYIIFYVKSRISQVFFVFSRKNELLFFCSRDMIETIVRVAENTVDEVTNSEGREVSLEEDFVLMLPFLLPEDGYSCDIVRGVPSGLTEFIAPLQRGSLCVMTPQPTSSGFWTIYMDNMAPLTATPVPRSPSEMSFTNDNHPAQMQHLQQMQHQRHINGPGPMTSNEPEVITIQLVKANGGMGLSIVAAKGVGKDKLGIYVKAVVDNGAAFHDGRLQAGDQLLKVRLSLAVSSHKLS